MSYRYNSVDIIVGVGMCAIVFGAMLFFVAASGTFQVIAPQSASVEQSSGDMDGMAWLQPALGQAIVERTLLQRRSDQMTVSVTAEWKQAMQARHDLQAMAGDPFGFIFRRGAVVPGDHMARLQNVMGHSIVNFTRRGIRSGVLSSDQPVSEFNTGMIAATQAMGQRLDREFNSTWQSVLGRWIVEASRNYLTRSSAVQEQLGAAIVHMAQAKIGMEDAWAANQYQLGSLLAAVDRTPVPAERLRVPATAIATRQGVSVASAGSVPWPEIPVGYLIAAALGLCAVFFGGLQFSAANREAKALAQMRHDTNRWMYRIAA